MCGDTHIHTVSSDLGGGASAVVWVNGSKRSVRLKSITKATASDNPIPSHPIQEVCAMWLARFPWGAEATAQAMSAYSLCQLWLWVCGRGGSRTLKERLVHFGRRRCELCRRTPTVCVCESMCIDANVSPSWGTLWEEQVTLRRPNPLSHLSLCLSTFGFVQMISTSLLVLCSRLKS